MIRRFIAVLATALMAVTACGGPRTTTTTTDGPTPITISAIAVSSAAPLEIGVREGYFAAEGLNATITYVEASAVVPSVMSGTAQFGFLNAPAVLVARNNGVPVVAVAGIGVPNPDPQTDYIQLLVRGDSDLRSFSDIAGKTVAVDTLYQLPDLALRHALRTAGVDPGTIEFVEIPFAQMVDALREGRVDAINASEPFVSAAFAAGARSVGSAFAGQNERWPNSVILSSQQYLNQNKDIVDRFRRAFARAVDHAQQNPDLVRALVPTFTQMPEQLAQAIRLPTFTSTFHREGWQGWVDALAADKLVEPDLDADEAFYDG